MFTMTIKHQGTISVGMDQKLVGSPSRTVRVRERERERAFGSIEPGGAN